MFVFSINSKVIKAISLLAVVAVATALTVAFSDRSSDASTKNGIVLRAENAKDRIAFLSQFGWEVGPEPVEIAEVIIPNEFDDTYTAYNGIQVKQGMNLEKYKGVRAKRYTYEINNYPGYPKESGCIRANLLVYEGRVIGGDVCSIELSGFMHGFELEEEKGAT